VESVRDGVCSRRVDEGEHRGCGNIGSIGSVGSMESSQCMTHVGSVQMNGRITTKGRSRWHKTISTTSLWSVLEEDSSEGQSIDNSVTFTCDHSHPATCPSWEEVLGSSIDQLVYARSNAACKSTATASIATLTPGLPLGATGGTSRILRQSSGPVCTSSISWSLGRFSSTFRRWCFADRQKNTDRK
jgi:hypothetical protein